MKINDVLGMGKILPTTKLMDVVSSGIGRLFKSYFDRRDVDAKVYEMDKLTQARINQIKALSEVMGNSAGRVGEMKYNDGTIALSADGKTMDLLGENNLENRVAQRIDYQQAKKQMNLENIVRFAAEELKNEPPITDEPIDDDWRSRFFQIAEDISNEDMQVLWAKILANEIKRPNSYSLRTLDVIRNLSKKEAEIFTKVANFALMSEGHYNLFLGDDDAVMEGKFGILYEEISLLREAGLIQTDGDVYEHFLPPHTKNEHYLIANDIVIIINIPGDEEVSVPVFPFTTAANELMTIIETKPTMDYYKFIYHTVKSEFPSVKMGYADFYGFDDEGNIKYREPLIDF